MAAKALACLLLAQPARAQPLASAAAYPPLDATPEQSSILVENQAGVGCADGAELTRRLEALGATTARNPRLQIQIRLSRDGGDLVARLAVSGPEQRVRTLRAPGPSCDVLANNLTAALALVLDQPANPAAGQLAPEQPLTEPPPSVPVALAIPTASPVRPAHVAATRDLPPPRSMTRSGPEESPSLHLVAGAALTFGLVPEALGAAALGLSVRQGPFSVWGLGFVSAESEMSYDGPYASGGFPVPGEPQPDPPSTSANMRFAGGQLRGCATLLSLKFVEGSACLLGTVAALHVEAPSFPTAPSARSWYAAGGGVVLATPFAAPVGTALEALVFAPLREEQFVLRGGTVVFETPAVGVWLGISGRVQIL